MCECVLLLGLKTFFFFYEDVCILCKLTMTVTVLLSNGYKCYNGQYFHCFYVNFIQVRIRLLDTTVRLFCSVCSAVDSSLN